MKEGHRSYRRNFAVAKRFSGFLFAELQSCVYDCDVRPYPAVLFA